MKINFSEFVSKRYREKNIDYTFDMETFDFEGEKMVPIEKVVVKGKIISQDNEILLDLKVKNVLKLVCSRCLGTFIYPMDVDIEERFTNDLELQNVENLTFVKDDVLDVTETVEGFIISALPFKRLCASNCKGLCQNCGKNLNQGPCSCNTADVDIRLAGLKALLENKEV